MLYVDILIEDFDLCIFNEIWTYQKKKRKKKKKLKIEIDILLGRLSGLFFCGPVNHDNTLNSAC